MTEGRLTVGAGADSGVGWQAVSDKHTLKRHILKNRKEELLNMTPRILGKFRGRSL